MKHVFEVAAVLLLVAPPHASSQIADSPDAPSCVAFPCELKGQIAGAQFRILVPDNWNKTLIVYLMGAKVPGNAPAELLVAPPVVEGSQITSIEQALLSRGYALAGSGVAEQDLQIKEEVQDTFALSTYFEAKIGKPQRVILVGTSLGALAALRLIEDFPRAFDGAIATCTPAAGQAQNFDRRLDFLLAYSVAFGWTSEWGTVGDLREGLDFVRDVNPKVQWPALDGRNRGGWEFVRMISGVAPEAFWQADPLLRSPGFGTLMWQATHQRESMEAFAGGPFTSNVGRRYDLSAAQRTSLAALGINPGNLLAQMNRNTNIAANARARAYVERFGSVSGAIRRPVLMLHTVIDAIADVNHESAYREAVEQSGYFDYLMQTYVKATGHCAFTSEQLLTALSAMERWLDTGSKPSLSEFPASQGFDTSFVPPAYPYWSNDKSQ